MCGVDYQHELGEVSDVVNYVSVAELKKRRTCWKECGIVEVEIRIKRWVKPQNLLRGIKK